MIISWVRNHIRINKTGFRSFPTHSGRPQPSVGGLSMLRSRNDWQPEAKNFKDSRLSSAMAFNIISPGTILCSAFFVRLD